MGSNLFLDKAECLSKSRCIEEFFDVLVRAIIAKETELALFLVCFELFGISSLLFKLLVLFSHLMFASFLIDANLKSHLTVENFH